MRAWIAAGLLAAIAASPANAREASDKATAKALRKCAPSTYEAALDCLDRILPARHQAALAVPDGSLNAHFGLGMFLRNNWGLWKEGPLYTAMKEMGFIHPDDMSGAILDGFAARERGESYRPTPPDPAVVQAQWDQAVREGRAGSVSCPQPAREPKTRKEFRAAMKACFDHMAKTLEEARK